LVIVFNSNLRSSSVFGFTRYLITFYRERPLKGGTTVEDILIARRWPFLGAMTIATLAGIYTAGVVMSKPPTCSGNPREFDRSLDWEETATGITSLRKELAARAVGHVLETAVGTGRNFAFYDFDSLFKASQGAGRQMDTKVLQLSSDLKSFTGVDISADVLQIAMEKVHQAIPRVMPSSINVSEPWATSVTDKLRLLRLDSQVSLPPPVTPHRGIGPPKYDTVIQSFGLCSIDDPIRALEAMASVIKQGTGRIILLEHGRGWPIINGRLDRNAESHFRQYGCWYNRDIEAIIQDAVSKIPGLTIVALRRPLLLQFGTLLWVELKLQH
jgi:methyltransferase OMS1